MHLKSNEHIHATLTHRHRSISIFSHENIGFSDRIATFSFSHKINNRKFLAEKNRKMKHSETDRSSFSIPVDIALKIASYLQVSDLCSLGSCSRFWRDLCWSDFLWESLTKERWPSLLGLSEGSSSSSSYFLKGWRSFYMDRHNEVAAGAAGVVQYVETSSPSRSLEVGKYLKAIEDLNAMHFGFKDVQLFLFKPEINPLLNLIGLHYCINWLGVPEEHVLGALDHENVSDRHVCVKWWKLGRWLHGFRLRDESHYLRISLADLAKAKKQEVLAVLHRGVIHEVLHVQITVADGSWTP